MIGQTGGPGSTILNEQQVYRDNAATSTTTRRAPREQEVTQDTQTSDTVTLSAEAVALARNVPPAAATSEAQETPASETPVENAQEAQLRFGGIDIQA